MTALSEWLAARVPPPPAPFDAYFRDVEGEAGADALAELGRRGLEAALARPGRVRASAFELLAADGFITYACEAAVEADDPERALERVLARVVAPDD